MRLPNQIREFQRILADFSACHKVVCPTNIQSLKNPPQRSRQSNPPESVSQPSIGRPMSNSAQAAIERRHQVYGRRTEELGREIWKLLVVAAFSLFRLESFLARWVSRCRRTAEDVRVDLGEATLWRGGR